MNEIGLVTIDLSADIPFDLFAQSKSTGSFILIDRITNATLGAGIIERGLGATHNVHLQKFSITKAERALQKAQTLVFYGLLDFQVQASPQLQTKWKCDYFRKAFTRTS